MRATLRRWLIRHIPVTLQPSLRSAQFALTRLLGPILRTLPGSSLTAGPPRAISLNLPTYVRDHGGPADSYVELYPESIVRRSPPRTVTEKIHPAFTAELNRSLPPAGYAVIAGGRVLTRTGAVIGPDDHLIIDVSHTFQTAEPMDNIHLILPKLPRVVRRAECVAVATTYRSDIYYHWLLDTLPRLHLLQRSRLAIDKIVIPCSAPYQQASLDMLGLSTAQIVSERGMHVQASSLVVPTMPGVPGNPPRWACDYLRKSLLSTVKRSSHSRRIYISRAKASSRTVINENELLPLLERFGFRTLYLEELSLQEQINEFSQAEAIVAPHGSGLANLVFCPPGACVIELFSPNYINVMYWALSSHLGLDYSYIVGDARIARSGNRGRHVHENIFVDAVSAENLLHTVLDS